MSSAGIAELSDTIRLWALACGGTAGVFGMFGDKHGEGILGCARAGRVTGVLDRVGGLFGSRGLLGRSA